MEEALAGGDDTSTIATAGHTYSGTSLVMDDAIHIRGNLGRPGGGGDGGSKNLYSGKATASGKATLISGNVYEAEFLPWYQRANRG